MSMSPRLRRLVLLTHVTTSVGWLGAVAAYLALDITAVTSQDIQTVRSSYLAMATTAWYAIVPLALATVLIGIVNALGTPWGLFRHYWVLAKLLLTLLAATVLLIEAPVITAMARAAASGTDPRELPGSLVHSIGGITVLLIITILSIYKPRGATRHGWRKQQEQRRRPHEQRNVLRA